MKDPSDLLELLIDQINRTDEEEVRFRIVLENQLVENKGLDKKKPNLRKGN